MEKLTNTRTIFTVVDMQNDFVTGSLAVAGGAEIVTPINQTAELVRHSGGTVIFTRDQHPEHTPHFDIDGGIWPVHCVAGTEGADFVPGLDVQPDDIILSKGMGQTDGYSGFEGIGKNGETLEQILQPRSEYERVIHLLSGLALEYCVQSTAIPSALRFADDPRVTTYLITDETRAVALQQADEANALRQMQEAGVIAISSDEARAMIERMI